jgi:hypothetical protein
MYFESNEQNISDESATEVIEELKRFKIKAAAAPIDQERNISTQEQSEQDVKPKHCRVGKLHILFIAFKTYFKCIPYIITYILLLSATVPKRTIQG